MKNELNEDLVEQFMDHFGRENIPNPKQYPRQFDFLIKSFLYHKEMKEKKNES